jgi:hypothetical protein
MKALPTIDIDYFYQLMDRRSENTCWDCLANLGKYLADLRKDVAKFRIKVELPNLSQEIELKDMGKMIKNFANLTAEQQKNCLATIREVGNKHRELANACEKNLSTF